MTEYAYTTGHYQHPDGAPAVKVNATVWADVTADHAVEVWYQRDDDSEATQIATVTIAAGERSGFVALRGEPMLPMESRIWLQSLDPAPEGLLFTIGFRRSS